MEPAHYFLGPSSIAALFPSRLLMRRTLGLILTLAALVTGCGDDETSAPTSCSDGVKNGAEVGVDCGGPNCKSCVAESCSAHADCASRYCVDGVCCDTVCSGACQGCTAQLKGSGQDGECGPVQAGTDPDNDCEDQGASSCHNDGSCDGAGKCQLYAAGTVCQAQACMGDTLVHADECDGNGVCANKGTSSCAPYACDTDSCKTSCTSVADCSTGTYCDAGGACVQQKDLGLACTDAIECISGVCADGVCCNIACDLLCTACTAAKKGSGMDGMCGVIGSGLDPDDECSDDGAATCGQDGTCNGLAGCSLYAAGTNCGDPLSCMSGTQTNADVCDGMGTCLDSGTMSCGAYSCGATNCLSSCAQPPDCTAGAYCTPASQCQPQKTVSAACADSYECITNKCSQFFPGTYICGCNTSSDCNSLTYCFGFLCANKLQAGNSCSDNSACLSNRCLGSPGTCDGCMGPTDCNPSHYCAPPNCIAKAQTGIACNNNDECLSGNCGGTCAPCDANNLCPTTHYCSMAGNCLTKKSKGTACSSNNECAAGNCSPFINICI